MTASDLFDAGKYYQRMLDQLDADEVDTSNKNYLNAILAFKWVAYSHKNLK
jgi:hypothetical protein